MTFILLLLLLVTLFNPIQLVNAELSIVVYSPNIVIAVKDIQLSNVLLLIALT